MDLPFKAEYAKSGRASCRGCKSTIEKDTLRLAVMVQSPMFDGKTPHWYHHLCFFTKQRPKTVDDIAHFESLRWDDQENIRSKVGASTSIIVPEKKGKKRDAAAAAAKKSALGDFTLEYSKSSRATCRGCEQKIMKEEYFRLPMEWSNEAVLEFLDLYEQESVIWNPAHPLHKDRNENVDAWRRIQEKLGGQCSVLDLKKKKDSLMASFRALFNKVRQSITTGMGPEDIYKPNWFAYAKMEKFLKAVYQPRVPMNTEYLEIKSEPDYEENENFADQDCDILHTESEVNAENESSESTSPKNVEETFKSPIKQNPKKNKRSVEAGVKEKGMDEAYSILKTVTRKPHQKDECDLYAELIARKLRKFDERTRDIVMNEIDNLIFRAKIGQHPLPHHSPASYHTPPTRPSNIQPSSHHSLHHSLEDSSFQPSPAHSYLSPPSPSHSSSSRPSPAPSPYSQFNPTQESDSQTNTSLTTDETVTSFLQNSPDI